MFAGVRASVGAGVDAGVRTGPGAGGFAGVVRVAAGGFAQAILGEVGHRAPLEFELPVGLLSGCRSVGETAGGRRVRSLFHVGSSSVRKDDREFFPSDHALRHRVHAGSRRSDPQTGHRGQNPDGSGEAEAASPARPRRRGSGRGEPGVGTTAANGGRGCRRPRAAVCRRPRAASSRQASTRGLLDVEVAPGIRAPRGRPAEHLGDSPGAADSGPGRPAVRQQESARRQNW